MVINLREFGMVILDGFVVYPSGLILCEGEHLPHQIGKNGRLYVTRNGSNYWIDVLVIKAYSGYGACYNKKAHRIMYLDDDKKNVNYENLVVTNTRFSSTRLDLLFLLESKILSKKTIRKIFGLTAKDFR